MFPLKTDTCRTYSVRKTQTFRVGLVSTRIGSAEKDRQATFQIFREADLDAIRNAKSIHITIAE